MRLIIQCALCGSFHVRSPNGVNTTITNLLQIWCAGRLYIEMSTFQILTKSDQWFQRYWPLKFQIFAENGGST